MKNPLSHQLPAIVSRAVRREAVSRSREISFRGCIAFASRILIAAAICAAFVSRAEAAQALSGHIPAAAKRLAPIGSLPGTNELSLAIGLPLRNQQALDALLRDVYDPASPSFHHFLTPKQFSERFGPSEGDYEALQAFARAHGLQVTATHPNRVVLDVKGSAAKIEKALGIKFRLYKHPTEARNFFAPDSEPVLDTSVPVLHIGGLDNYSVPQPMIKRKAVLPGTAAAPAGRAGSAAPAGPAATTVPAPSPSFGSGVGGSYLGLDFRDAYVPGTPLNGNNQSVALLEFDGYFAGDIAQYTSAANLPAVQLVNILIDGYSGAAGNANVEVALDIEMCNAMAPGLSKIYVYEAPLSAPWEDILTRIANDNLAHQISSSWGGGSINPNPTAEQIFQQMAAQGQSYFNASGDFDAYTSFVPFPSDSPNVTVVGGTTLFTTGPLGNYTSEKVWNWGGGSGSSGGISPNFGIPTWQRGVDMSQNHGSTAFRNLPDVALTADNIFIVADNGTPELVGGTSAASPLWAAFTALVNQQGATSGRQPVGFLNPAIYTIGKSSAGAVLLHDTTLGDNTSPISPNNFFAVPGYDLCTGWGSPAGTNLINVLAPAFPAPILVSATNFISGGNGNGSIDPDECNNLTVVLENIGSVAATHVSASIFTTNAQVFISQRTSSFSDIPTNGFATNLTLLGISTTPDFVCGTPIRIEVGIKCDQGTFDVPLTFQTGSVASSNHFVNVSDVLIPDNDPIGADSMISVSNFVGTIGKVTVSLYLTHTFDSDLNIALIAPDGTTNILSANEGGAGHDFGFNCTSDSSETTFDDSASTPISAGSAPFLGIFQPDAPLSVYIGKSGTNVNGTWTLHVVDQAFLDVGTLHCWSLNLFPTKCLAGGGQCPGVDLSIGMTSSPEPATQFSNFVYTITVTNAGPDTASTTVANQLLPSGVKFISGTASQGNVSQAGGLVTVNLGSLAAGAVATANITVSTTNTGVITSTASVTSNNNDFDTSNNSVTLLSHVNPPFSDLSVALHAAPDTGLVGQPLTYTITVANNGPSLAANVTVTNLLPPTTSIQSVSSSNSIVGNTVVCFFGNLTNNAQATATIVVQPFVVGTITASSTVATSGSDPNPANNTASVSTVIGPSADLALSLVASPASVVLGSNIVYTLSVTNFGPSPASSVVLNDSLPPGVTVISTNTSKGSVSVSGGSVIASIGSLTNGETASVTIRVSTAALATNTVSLSDSATVSALEGDPNTPNNSASVTVSIAQPFVAFAIQGVQLTSESFPPANGAVDPGETVTANFFIQNVGNIPNNSAGLVVTLLASNGVVSPSGPVNFGVIAPSGVQSGPFSFTGNGTNGGTIVANLLLQNGTSSQILTFTFQLPKILVFANTNRIDIPRTTQDQLQPGPAGPYPSTINVSGVSGSISRVTVTLSNLNHTFPHDINLLLVGPTGRNTLLLSAAADGSQVSQADVTFDDFAPAQIPASGQIVSGVYQPSGYDTSAFLTNPAPIGPYGSTLASYLTLNPNGLWSLYAYDDSAGDFGYVGGGWSVAFTAVSPVNQIANLAASAASLPASVLLGGFVTNTFTITNSGPAGASVVWITNTLSSSVTLQSIVNSAGVPFTTNGNQLVANLGAVPSGATRTVTLVVSANAAGVLTNSISVAAVSGELDLSPADNSADAVFTANLPNADLVITNYLSADVATVEANTTLTIGVTNLGPQNALSVVVSNAIPAGFTLVSSNSSVGAAAVSTSGTAWLASLGTIQPGSNAWIALVIKGSAAGSYTNISRVFTASTDPVSTNNVAAAILRLDPPAPLIQTAAALLVAEGNLPPNGAVDPGETVTVALYLTNSGTANSTNLTAALLAGGGVINASGAANYGTLVAGGAAVSNYFTFTAGTPVNGQIQAVLQLSDAGGYAATVTNIFYLPGSVTGSNTVAITIPDHGPASPFPSVIPISGVTGVVQKVTVTLNGLTHTFPHDIDALLVSPTGQKIMLMGQCGGGHSVSGVNLTFDDSAAGTLPDSSQIVSGTYKPSNFDQSGVLPAPAPGGPLLATLSSLSGISPNGNWSLYVFDGSAGDSGSVAGGWSIAITTLNPVNPVVNLVLGMRANPGTLLAGKTLTYTLTLTNLGPATATNVSITDHLPAGMTLVSSNTTMGSLVNVGSTVTLTNLSLAPAAGLVCTFNVLASGSGTIVNTAVAAAAQPDLDPLSNTAQATVSIVVAGPAALTMARTGGQQFQITITGDPAQGYQLQMSSNLVNWIPVFTGTTAPNGILKFSTNSSSQKVQFYRSVRLQ